ncbi:hypothetical protein [Rhodospirillum sp. A1_3_36]|uniref:hypothetical protein n=1 Tax=Rhodospirillum sp. A1_3_36 TaxID=3391666 RepID=UPI0039A662F6
MAARSFFLLLALALSFSMAVDMVPSAFAAESAGGTKPTAAGMVEETRVVNIVVNAMPLASYDATRSISLRVMDNSPANVAILDSLRAALAARGVVFATGEDDTSALRLDLDTSASSAVVRPDPDQSPLSVSAIAGTSNGSDAVDVTLRLYSNVQGSVLGGDRDAPKPSLGGPDLRLDLGLTDPQTGRRLWQGWGTVSAPDLGIEGQGLLIVSPLADALGKSVIKQVTTVELDMPPRP